MPALEEFTPDDRGLRVVEADPVIEEHRNVLYVPFRSWELDTDPSWGLYDQDGKLIEAAAYRRGPSRKPVGQSPHASVPAAAIEPAPEEHYVVAGPLLFHYGHFLLTSLSRLWPEFGAGARFAWFCHCTLDILPHTPFVGAALAGLGLDPKQFRRFTKPTRIARATVVAPAFQEDYLVHRVFARTCCRVGAHFAPELGQTPLPPAYLARTGLAAAVKSVANEDAVCAALAAYGVEIVRPETLSFPEQLALFAGDRVIMGLAGSAFHTAAFVPPRSRLIAIEMKDNPNQLLLNRLAGLGMRHLRPTQEVPSVVGAGPVETVYTFPDPAAVARDLLRAAQGFR